MSVSEIKKVQILAFAGMRMSVLTSLQEEGLIQIENANFEELGLATKPLEVSHIDHILHRLAHCLDFLSAWEETSFKSKLFSQKPQLSLQDRENLLNSDFSSVLDKTEKIEREKQGLLAQIKFLEKENEFLSPLKELDIPVKTVSGTERTSSQIGVFPSSKLMQMETLAEEENLFYSLIEKDKRQTYLVVFFLTSEKVRIEDELKKINFNSLYFTDPILERAGDSDTVKDVLKKFTREIEQKQQRIEDLDREGQELANHRQELMRVYDVYNNEREKLLSSHKLGETERTVFLTGWIQSEDIDRLKEKLSPYSDQLEYYFLSPEPDEEPPVILKNPRIWKPFEVITKLYGLPQRGYMDPTIALAPFFFIFVGLTVSEAGYGMLVGLLSFLFLKFAKPKGDLRQFLILLTILGAATVILGTLVGGWFGFPIRKLMVLDPMKDPVSFLILSLALGFVQVWFGTLLSAIWEIKRKNYLEGIFVQGGWLVLLPFLGLYGLTKTPLWGIFALLGAAGIVLFGFPSRNPIARFFGGLYKLYDITRYLADVLSYSRLLALGLATSVIAMVANTLSQTALKIPWVGWLFAGLIFIGMHLFNLGISFLGGFVHSMRLQFVEFFSKFYTAGGKPFKPFELKAKYVEFTK